MKLYVQDENYHFDGFLSGVIIDKNRTAIFKKWDLKFESMARLFQNEKVSKLTTEQLIRLGRLFVSFTDSY